MATNVQKFKALLMLRRYLRDNAERMINEVAMFAQGDAELVALLRPHAVAYRDAVQTVLAGITTAAQGISLTNAEKVAEVNAELLNLAG